jgi:hypothetical protein
MPPMNERNSSVSEPSGAEKMFLPVFDVDHRLVDVHRVAGFALHRLGHEGGVHVVLQRCLADRALHQEHLVGKRHRVAVAQVDFQLRRAFLVDQRVDLQPLRLAEMVDVVDQLVILVDAGDRIGVTARNLPARAAHGRLQLVVRIGVARDEIELDLRRDDRLPALVGIGLDNAAQHRARRVGDVLAVGADEVADHLRRRVAFPRHHGQGGEIRHQLQVAVMRVVAEIAGFLRDIRRKSSCGTARTAAPARSRR